MFASCTVSSMAVTFQSLSAGVITSALMHVACRGRLDVQAVKPLGLPGAAGHCSKAEGQPTTSNIDAIAAQVHGQTCIHFVTDRTIACLRLCLEVAENGCWCCSQACAEDHPDQDKTCESLQYAGAVLPHATSRVVCRL
jgi:hypothetical protein